MTLPVHYQTERGDWPLCGDHPMSYDSTSVWALVTCKRCRILRPNSQDGKGWRVDLCPDGSPCDGISAK